MKIGKTLISKRTIALACVAVLLFTFGSVMGVRAARQAPAIQSSDLEADFELQHLGVHLLENGKLVGLRSDGGIVAGGNGKLLEYMASEEDPYGTFVPGKKYEEKIAAQNRTNVDQYLRITIHKYWQDPVRDEEGNITGFIKNTALEPKLIKLTYGNKAYNDSAWTVNERESTEESETYYYNKALPGNSKTADLFNQLVVSNEILSDVTSEESKVTEGNTTRTVITYVYKYDDKYIGLEADVQALQTHNANDAIKGIWGVRNVTVSGGKLTVK
ncbi:MAG: hypothetical protein IJV66_04040 [Firmicutes bacterium]|nr:hypothetical protein [Bacillota bacterium]